jgi:hypothetical protein
MPLRRTELPTDDVAVLWWANGVDLVRRLQALEQELRIEGHQDAADSLLSVLTGEYNPLPDQLPELGDPPRPLRPAVPPPVSLPLAGEHVPRRAPDPGA